MQRQSDTRTWTRSQIVPELYSGMSSFIRTLFSDSSFRRVFVLLVWVWWLRNAVGWEQDNNHTGFSLFISRIAPLVFHSLSFSCLYSWEQLIGSKIWDDTCTMTLNPRGVQKECCMVRAMTIIHFSLLIHKLFLNTIEWCIQDKWIQFAFIHIFSQFIKQKNIFRFNYMHSSLIQLMKHSVKKHLPHYKCLVFLLFCHI